MNCTALPQKEITITKWHDVVSIFILSMKYCIRTHSIDKNRIYTIPNADISYKHKNLNYQPSQLLNSLTLSRLFPVFVFFFSPMSIHFATNLQSNAMRRKTENKTESEKINIIKKSALLECQTFLIKWIKNVYILICLNQLSWIQVKFFKWGMKPILWWVYYSFIWVTRKKNMNFAGDHLHWISVENAKMLIVKQNCTLKIRDWKFDKVNIVSDFASAVFIPTWSWTILVFFIFLCSVLATWSAEAFHERQIRLWK